MTAIQSLLTGFLDYAGLYPPSSLTLRSAANNYLDYAECKHAAALGRFIINADRLEELHSIVGDSLKQFRLSVIVPEVSSLEKISIEISNGAPIETLEIKPVQLEMIETIASKLPQALVTYLEISFDSHGLAALSVISRLGMRAKIRMGGVVAEAFPAVSAVIEFLKTLAKHRIPFKATAGLHHPIRSTRPLTYERQSAKGTMHGFINLFCAAAVLYFDGSEDDAEMILQEEDCSAWRFGPDTLQWRHLKWSQDQLSTLRREFFMSIGTCSFKEPIGDLQSLGWL